MWGKSWLSCLKVKVIYVLGWICWQHTFNKVLVSYLMNFEQFLVLIAKFFFNITFQINTVQGLVVSQKHFGCINFEVWLYYLSHFVIKKTMGIFLPLDTFDTQYLIVKLSVTLSLVLRIIAKHEHFLLWYVWFYGIVRSFIALLLLLAFLARMH